MNQTSEQKKNYNQEVLGLTYNGDEIENPFAKKSAAATATVAPVEDTVSCDGGVPPDAYGCCAGETYTDNGPIDPDDPNGPHSYVCCPVSDPENCFPPIVVQ